MMMKSMSLGARRELQSIIKQKYHNASWADRSKSLDGFVAATDYERKYAIQLLNSAEMPILPKKRPAFQKYDERVLQALISVCGTATKLAQHQSRDCRSHIEAGAREHQENISTTRRDNLLKASNSRVILPYIKGAIQ